MKTLLLLRHGKAQPDAPHGDKARALTERGRTDSRAIGEKLATVVPALDLIVSSGAVRADQTAEIAAAAAGYSGEIATNGDIYYAEVDTLLEVVRDLPDSADRVLLVGHNPGFEELAAALAQPGTEPPHLPTAALAHIEFEAARRWREAREGAGRLVAVHLARERKDEGEAG